MSAIYMDFAASTPMSKSVLNAMLPYMENDFQNPSAIYLSAKKVRQDVEEARHKIASTIGARSSEIIFTAGGTEANNLAILGVAKASPNTEILCSAIEHDSVLEPVVSAKGKLIKVDSRGVVDLDDLKKQLSAKTVLVSIMMVNNEIGIIQPIKEIVNIIKEERANRDESGNDLPIYLHTDACQAANYLNLNVNQLGADLMTVNGSKIYGPKQAGFLYIRAGVELQPIILGGGQESNLRSGTENVPSIIGLAVAFMDAQKKYKNESKRIFELRNQFIKQIHQISDDIEITSELANRAPHIVHISIDGEDNETLAMKLDELGIECAVGSACSAYDSEPSHVLKAIGMSDSKSRSSIRFSLGRNTTKDHILSASKALQKSVINR